MHCLRKKHYRMSKQAILHTVKEKLIIKLAILIQTKVVSKKCRLKDKKKIPLNHQLYQKLDL